VTKLVGLSGSLRQRSFNSSLLRAAVEMMPQGAEMTIGSIRDIPLYDGDLEDAQGVPGPAQALKDAIAAADGLLLVTPEYNNSIPGVFKNAIDWLSRPPADISRVFGGQARRNNWGITGRLRDNSQPRGVAASAAHIGNQTLVWWPAACVSRRNRLRPKWADRERRHQRTASTIHRRLSDLCAEHSKP
jgi:NADPH-dependent FMN reductase